MAKENATKYIKEAFQNDFSGHDFFHSMRVYRTAMKIAQAEHADLEVVALPLQIPHGHGREYGGQLHRG